jgi:hypothetical protein
VKKQEVCFRERIHPKSLASGPFFASCLGMKRQVTEFAKREQLINWGRAFLAGAFSASLMMAFMDIFTLMGITRFSYEAYLGSLILQSTWDTHIFTAGVLANWILGGVFGFFYAFFFESVFRKAGVRIGIACGLYHAILAAAAFSGSRWGRRRGSCSCSPISCSG